MIKKYHLEFVLLTQSGAPCALRSSLAEFGEELKVTDCPDSYGKSLKINIVTEEPESVFDICGQFGRIKSVKID